MQAQDSTHETGVAVVEGTRGGKEVTRARDRKAKSALALSLQGANWRTIARQCGYPTERAAKVAVELMLERRLDAMDRQHLRLLVSGRLDALLKPLWKKATDEESPEHLAAVGRAREIIADTRKLWGLDAPQEITIHSPTQEQIDEWVARVMTGTLPEVEEADIVEADIVEDEDDALPAG